MFKKKILIAMFLVFTQQSLVHANSPNEKDVILSIKKGVKFTESLLKKSSTYQVYKDDKTILHYAVELKAYDVVEFLLDKADLSRQGGIYYQTALQDAIFYGYLGIAELLIVHGTDVNIKNIDGETALHLAAKRGYTNIIKLLMKAGASTNIQDEDGNTPRDVVPELIWDSSSELKKVLTVEKKTNVMKNIIPQRGITITKKSGHTSLIINEEHKTIYKNSIEKSRVENSSVGMVID